MPNSGTILPNATDIEKVCLGCVLLDDAQFPIVGQALEEGDFFDYKNRMIFGAMKDLQARGQKIDRITIYEALQQRGESERVPLSYLVDLDTGAPMNFNVGSYVRLIAEKSRLRKIVTHSRDLYNCAVAPDAISSEVISKGQSGLTEISNTLDASGRMISEYIEQFPGGVNRLLNPAQFDQGIATGFFKLDEWTSGIHPKEIWTIAARPGVGKTAFGLNVISYIAKGGGFCPIFSLEMSKQSCLNRFMCAEARVDVNKFRRGYLNKEEQTRLQVALSKIDRWPIYIDDSSGLKVSDISMRLQSLSRERPITLCMIDYFQLLRPPKTRRYGTENEMFTEIAHDLQLTAKNTGIPVLLLSQLNRDSEKANGDKRPKISQCRGAGAIEEISNFAACIFREGMAKRDRDDLRGVASLLCDKNREGPTGDISLVYLDYLTKFENRAEDLPDTDYKAAAAGE